MELEDSFEAISSAVALQPTETLGTIIWYKNV